MDPIVLVDVKEVAKAFCAGVALGVIASMVIVAVICLL